MAEIGVIASVIGVAGAGFRLSLILNAVGAEVANAGVEIHTISKGVTLFSLMLKQVGQHLQSPDSVHSDEAIRTAQTITDECQHVFDEISEMLDRVQSRKGDGSASSPTIQQRFRWCFKKHKVTYLLAQLESLKMNLLVMLQILQLGKLMVTPPRSEAKQDVAQKEDMIQQERAETQNIVIVRYWQINRLERLYYAAEQEDIADRKAELETHNQNILEGTQPQLSIEAPPSPTYSALIKLPVVSFGGDLDQTLNRIKDSPKDMIQVSESVIDPLLHRWTRCYEILTHTNGRSSNGTKFAPSVHDLYELDEDLPRHDTRQPDSPEMSNGRGLYLEGTTTNWREPHSEAARREAARLRKQYSGYQPSVNDEPDPYDVKPVKKPTTTRHVIDSDLSSSSDSDSEYEKPQKRLNRRKRSSASLSDKNSRRHSFRRTPSQSYSDQSNPARFSSSPMPSSPLPRNPVPSPYPVQNRPIPHHSISSPLPPLHTGNVQNQYQASRGPAPPAYSVHASQAYSPRFVPPPPPQHLATPARPASSDGKNRSPSRTSGTMPPNHLMTEEERRRYREKQNKNFRRGATRSLLGAGAIAGFLEALEGLSI